MASARKTAAPKAHKPAKKRCHTKRWRDKRGKLHRKKVCAPVKRTPKKVVKKVVKPPAPHVVPKPVAVAPAKPDPRPISFPQPPAPQPPAPSKQDPPTLPPAQTLSRRQAERLLWRAGFGPRPGDVDAVAQLPLASAVQALTRPPGAPTLTGPEPHDDDGYALAPESASGHDHLFLMDRMVRSDQQLVERMALVFHDWFGVSREGVGTNEQMLAHFQLFRDKGLGTFKDLLAAVTGVIAMLLFLNGKENTKRNPNENYARELMELYTLGADRGAYSEADVRELARALT